LDLIRLNVHLVGILKVLEQDLVLEALQDLVEVAKIQRPKRQVNQDKNSLINLYVRRLGISLLSMEYGFL